jgi:hypothetical protein
VGGGSKTIPLPGQYAGWRHVLLDVDPGTGADVLCDARTLETLPGREYDAVYCSHNLEHYYPHDVPKVLAGFRHLLKPDGFVHIRVPDIGMVMRLVVEKNLDITDVLYQSDAGPVSVGDVIYGFRAEIENSGNDFYAHKTGFTEKSLSATLNAAGFGAVFISLQNLEIQSVAFAGNPTAYAAGLFGLPVQNDYRRAGV